MSIADELQKLETLRASGAISDDEFALAKRVSWRPNRPPRPPCLPPDSPSIFSRTCSAGSGARPRYCWLGGVCGGLGEISPIPSWVYRILFCALIISFGVGLIPYILLMIFVPDDTTPLSAG